MKKKILAAIFAVLLILSLASCAGIGDGALFRRENTEKPQDYLPVMPAGAKIYARIEDHVSITNSLSAMHLSGEKATELFDLIFDSSYTDQDKDFGSAGSGYYEIFFIDGSNGDETVPVSDNYVTAESIRVFEDDRVYVVLNNNINCLGFSNGIFNKVRSIFHSVKATYETIYPTSCTIKAVVEGKEEGVYDIQFTNVYSAVAKSIYTFGTQDPAYENTYFELDFYELEDESGNKYKSIVYRVFADDFVVAVMNSGVQTHTRYLGRVEGIYNTVKEELP